MSLDLVQYYIRQEGIKMAINRIKITKPVAKRTSGILRGRKSRVVKSVAASDLCNAKRKTR